MPILHNSVRQQQIESGHIQNKNALFPLSISSCIAIFDSIHVHIWGPFSIPFIQGNCYFLKIVDDYSLYTYMIIFYF